jgi:hypothetical protein
MAEQDFSTFAAASFDAGGVTYFAAYEPVYESNVQSVPTLYIAAILTFRYCICRI